MSLEKMFSLHGKQALITGGAGGIGFACAEALAEAGASLILAGRNEKSLDEAKAKVEIWLVEKAKEQLAYHMRSIDFYKELLEDLPKDQNREF